MTVATRPHAGPTRAYHFPRFERRQLDSGLTLVVAPVRKLPVVTVLALVDAGAMTDPRGKEGIAQLTASALTEGTARYDGEVLTDILEQLGTSIDASADWDAATVTLTVLSDHLSGAFEQLAEVLTAPTFPERSVERLKGERIAEILQVESEPRILADEMFESFAYTAESRFATPAGGTKRSVASIGRDDVNAFYEARYRPGSTTIIVVGDVDAETVGETAVTAFGQWAAAAVTPASAIDTVARRTRAIQVVRKEDAPQSELRLGHVSVPRGHPDYFRITVMNAILGGLFSSRINLNLREAHGYTYGAHSTFDWRRRASPFVVSTAVESNVTAAALRETLSEIDRMRREGVTESELTLATSYLDGVFPIRFETTAAIATALAAMTVYGLPDDWYDTYREHVRGVSADDVLHAIRTHVDPDLLQVVVVGNPDVILAPLQALDFGPVTVRDAVQHSGGDA